MAAAKLLLAALLFVLLPLVVVMATAVAAAVPPSHWPSTMGQVLCTDAALVGLTMAVATRTRTVSTLVIAVVGCLLLGYLLLGAAFEVRRLPALARWVTAGALDPDTAFPTMWLWASLGLWCVTVIGYAGYRRRNAFAVTVGITVAAMLTAWVVPQARLHARDAADATSIQVTIAGGEVRAERIPGRAGVVGLTARPRLVDQQPGDRVQAFLLEGRITGAGTSRPSRLDGDPRSIVLGSLDNPQTPLLAILPAAEFAALAGMPMRFRGRLNVEVARSTLVASAPMAAGTRVRAAASQVTIGDVLPTSADIPQPVATGTLVEMYVPGLAGARGREYRVRDPAASCSAPLYARGGIGSQLAFISLLPTLARPFTVQRGTLVVIDRHQCRPEPGRSVLEAHELRTLRSTQDVQVDFVMPTAVEPEQPVRVAR
jgi:hypothetical protein